MGMFSWLNEDETEVDRDNGLLNAVGCLCLLATSADGVISNDETNAIVDMIKTDERFSALSANYKAKAFNQIASEVHEAMKSGNTEAFIDSKCDVIFDLCESEFALEKIKQIIKADGKVEESELKFLSDIGKSLGVPIEDSEKDKGLFNAVMSLCLLAAYTDKSVMDDELQAIVNIVKNDKQFSSLSKNYKAKVFGETAKEVHAAMKSLDIDDFVIGKCNIIRNLGSGQFALSKIQQIIDADRRLSKNELKFVESISKCLGVLYRKNKGHNSIAASR